MNVAIKSIDGKAKEKVDLYTWEVLTWGNPMMTQALEHSHQDGRSFPWDLAFVLTIRI